jgi:hypothetical protein
MSFLSRLTSDWSRKKSKPTQPDKDEPGSQVEPEKIDSKPPVAVKDGDELLLKVLPFPFKNCFSSLLTYF